MASERVKRRKNLVRTGLVMGVALSAAACASAGKLNPLKVGQIDSTSPVAGDIRAAQRAPGGYPKFSHVPPVPKDVRTASAWRDSVSETWALKRQTEAEAAAIPFVLTAGAAEPWAEVEHAKIPASETTPPAADANAQAEAFAAAAHARATPPPPPK